jgi:hypothetical protein
MAGRAAEMVALVQDDQGSDRLDIMLVAPVPADWIRDGVSADAPSGTSLGVHALVQVVAATPLPAWSALAPAEHLLLLAGEHELGSLLIDAWSRAAAAQRDAAWAKLLLDQARNPALVAALAPDDVLAAATRHAGPGEVLDPLSITLLETVAVPWPSELRQQVAASVVALFGERRAGRHNAPLLRRLVRAMDLALLSPLAEALAGLGLSPPIDGVRDDTVDVMRFRAAMLAELLPGGQR